MVRNTTSVAVYWDFENVHIALRDAHNGKSTRAGNHGKESALVKISSVVRYLESLGDVVVQTDFADWRRFSCYRKLCLMHCIELMQIFPPGTNAKNGADIRLAVEAVDDVCRLDHISRVVILGGDSDFIPLAQKLRQFGKAVTGIAVLESTNEFWPHACSDFKFYRSLLSDSTADADNGSTKRKPTDGVRDVDKLVVAAVRAAQALSASDWVTASSVGHQLGEIYAGLDSRNFGCRSLTEMLESCGIVELRKQDHAVSVRLRRTPFDDQATNERAKPEVRLHATARPERSVA